MFIKFPTLRFEINVLIFEEIFNRLAIHNNCARSRNKYFHDAPLLCVTFQVRLYKSSHNKSDEVDQCKHTRLADKKSDIGRYENMIFKSSFGKFLIVSECGLSLIKDFRLSVISRRRFGNQSIYEI